MEGRGAAMTKPRHRAAKNARREIAADALGFHDPLCREVTVSVDSTDVNTARTVLTDAIDKAAYDDTPVAWEAISPAIDALIAAVRAEERHRRPRR